MTLIIQQIFTNIYSVEVTEVTTMNATNKNPIPQGRFFVWVEKGIGSNWTKSISHLNLCLVYLGHVFDQVYKQKESILLT